VLGKIGVCFHFENLLGVAIAMCGDEENPFVGVHLLAERTFGSRRSMSAQVSSVLQVLFRTLTAFAEVLQRRFRRSETIGRFQRFGGLGFVAAIGNLREDQLIDRFYVIVSGSSRSLHNFVSHIRKEKILRRGDMLNNFRDRPSVWSRLEIPLLRA